MIYKLPNTRHLSHAFEELQGEANRLDVLNNGLKGLNNWLEEGVNKLVKELTNLIEDFENLDMIYSN